jgi:hypothetical protein
MEHKKTHVTNSKKLFLATLFVALIALPLTVIKLQSQKDQRSSATAATVVSFAPTSSQTAPIQKNPNETIPLDIMVNPGTNAVSIVTVVVQYDPAKLSLDQATGFQANAAVFPTITEGPVFANGQFAIGLSIGSDPTRAVTSSVKAGTLTFTAIDGTGTAPTIVSFTTQTSVQSVGANDSANENVLQSTVPAVIAISGTATNPTTNPQQSPIPTADQGTPIPTTAGDMVTPSGTQTSPIPSGIGGNDNPIPTLAITPVASGSAYTPEQFKQFLTLLFSNRIINMRNVLLKISKGQSIPPGQLKRLQKEQEPIVTFFTQLVQLLKTSTTQQNATQAAASGLNGMLNNYQTSNNQLDSFSQGLQGVITDLQTQGADMTSAQAQLTEMKSHIKTVGGLTRSSQDALSSATTQTELKSSVTKVEDNVTKIKSEFAKAKENLSSIRTALQGKQK